MNPSKASTTIAFLLIILVVLMSYFTLRPPGDHTSATQAQKMDLKQVENHVATMCGSRHFTGTPEHMQVRRYIVDQLEQLGLTVEIQEQMVYFPKWRTSVQVHNILARIKGTRAGKALLLLSHYDSAPVSSLGASDDGSGVAVILEAVRAFIKNGRSAKNDIIILLTDAEELGLMGAKGFIQSHRWAKDVGLALNFEARGSGGPSYMLMETNGGNRNLLRGFMKAHPGYPVASSLMYSIYKMLPNDMDLTVFREDADIDGFNFAFIGDHFDYHTAQDKPERLDKATLVQQMDYLASTLSYFKDADLSKLSSTEEDVYFNLPYLGMWNYPFSWVWPMAILAILLTLLYIVLGIRTGKIAPINILYSFVVHLVLVLIAGALGGGFWTLMKALHPQYADILQGFTYNGYMYIGAVASGSVALWSLAYYYFLKRKTPYEIATGPVLLWLIINVLIAMYLKGGGYFVLPLLSMLIGLILSLVLRIAGRFKFWILLGSSIFGLLIFAPLVQMFVVGLGLKILFLCAGLTILTLGFVEPVTYYFNMKWLAIGAGVVFVLLFVRSEMHSKWDQPDRKQPDGLVYLYDGTAGEAWWLTFNRHPDQWLSSIMGENMKSGHPEKVNFMTKYRSQVRYYNTAPKIHLPPPTISYQKNDTLYPNRVLYTLKYSPQRGVNKVTLMDQGKHGYTYMQVNGEAIGTVSGDTAVLTTGRANKLLSYYLTPSAPNLELSFMTKGDEAPELDLFEMSFDLDANSALNIPPMPAYVMPMPFVNSNAVMARYSPALSIEKE